MPHLFQFPATGWLRTTLRSSRSEQEKAQGRFAQIGNRLLHSDLVILDELGHLPFSASAKHPAQNDRHQTTYPKRTNNSADTSSQFRARLLCILLIVVALSTSAEPIPNRRSSLSRPMLERPATIVPREQDAPKRQVPERGSDPSSC